MIYFPSDRSTAKLYGFKYYFTNVACKNKHISIRNTKSGGCLACFRMREANRRKTNPEYYIEKRKRDKEYHLEYSKKHREENREEINLKGRVRYHKNIHKQRERNRQYTKNNPDKANARTALRRARISKATPLWVAPPYKQEETPEQKTKFKDIRKQMQSEIREFYTEAVRLTDKTGIKHVVDHYWPITHDDQSGLHVPDNLRVIPESDNIAKSNKLPNDPNGWHMHPDNPNRTTEYDRL